MIWLLADICWILNRLLGHEMMVVSENGEQFNI